MIANPKTLLHKIIFVAAIALLVCGCHEKCEITPPDMAPVSGKVVASPEKIPAGYSIILTPSDRDLEKTATGIVSEDGSFTMQTRYMGGRFDGAAKGTYQVVLQAPYEQGGQRFSLPQTVEISDATTDLTIQFP